MRFASVDIIIVFISLFFAYRLRTILPLATIQSIEFYKTLFVSSPILLTSSLIIFRVYRHGRALFPLSYLVDYLKGLFLWAGLVVAFAFFTKTDYSRVVIALMFLFTFLLTLLARLFAAWLAKEEVHKDAEINGVLDQVVHLSERSPDTLSLLEGLNAKSSPEVFYLFFKRLFDVAVSVIGLAAFFLLLPFFSYAIKRDSPGPVFLRQERVGNGGKKFTLYKLRTMQAETPLYEPAPRYHDDPRITRAGKFLRRYSLDELPQLWNVLRGEMSIVGPRPEMPFIVERYNDWQKLRLKVKPGITGLWQILGRKDAPLEENLQYDFYYVFNQSFFLDLAIILRTIPHLFFPRGAY